MVQTSASRIGMALFWDSQRRLMLDYQGDWKETLVHHFVSPIRRPLIQCFRIVSRYRLVSHACFHFFSPPKSLSYEIQECKKSKTCLDSRLPPEWHQWLKSCRLGIPHCFLWISILRCLRNTLYCACQVYNTLWKQQYVRDIEVHYLQNKCCPYYKDPVRHWISWSQKYSAKDCYFW